MLEKIEGKRRKGWQKLRGLDSITDSMDMNLSKFLNNRMISVHFQGKPFNITVIQVYAPVTNAEEAEVEWFYEPIRCSRTNRNTHTYTHTHTN